MPIAADPPSGPVAPAPLVAALNSAGLRMFRTAAGDRNLALSPVSIGLAFGMVDAGASGEVDDALGRLFSYPCDGEDLLAAFRSLMTGVMSDEGGRAENADGESVELPTVRIANGLWCDESYTAEPAYVDAVRRWFHAEVSDAPFRTDPQGSRAGIDAWVERRTDGLIPTIMPPDLPNPDTVVVLASTVYVKARWWEPFDPESTSEEDFERADGTRTDTLMMRGEVAGRYLQRDDLDAVVLPYVGDLELVVVVPRRGRLAEVRSGLDSGLLASLDAAWATGHVAVALPRFESTSEVDLADVIEGGLGVSGLFGAAGLDGIGPDLQIDAAVHATKVIVDEGGTEAAAATVIGIMLTGLPIYDAEIRADRPFLYLMRDRGTGAILVVGQQVDPTGG